MVILLRCTGTLATNYTIMSVCTGEAKWEPDVSQVVQECKSVSQSPVSESDNSQYLIVVIIPLAVAILFLFMLVIILLVVTALKVNQRRGK